MNDNLRTTAVEELIRLWALRMLVPLGGHCRFGEYEWTQCRHLVSLLDLPTFDPGDEKFKENLLRALRHRHSESEMSNAAREIPPTLRRNIEQLQDLVGLTEVDGRILEFAVLLHTSIELEQSANMLGELSTRMVPRILAVLLDRQEAAITDAFHDKANLARLGLLTLELGTDHLTTKLRFASRNFAVRLCSHLDDIVDLLRGRLTSASAPELILDDYRHVQDTLEVLRPYVRAALDERRRGVNILIYGPPGTGKSQLARVLARDQSVELLEVAIEGERDEAFEGEKRLTVLRLAQTLLGNRKALLLFEEASDVFSDFSVFNMGGTAQARKAWVNRLLENNSVPTLWLLNSVRGIDPAFLRRFDVVFELNVPPERQRQQLASRLGKGLLIAEAVQRIAAEEAVTPGIIARAAAVVRVAGECIPVERRSAAVEHLVENTLVSQGHVGLSAATGLPQHYDPRYVNVDVDLCAIADGIACTRSARLCLYGPPGTGKTAFGRWLSQHAGMPLIVKRASDLTSMFLGETEKNIARAFREAARDGALLLIDEVDSFLQDRRNAQRSWEVAQVNELLTQMEQFPGVFVASTNLMDGLDQAALRRFDLKLRFDYLHSEAAGDLFVRHCESLGFPAPGAEDLRRLASLRCLTPGDFAAVLRRARFHPVASPREFIAALEGECILKEQPKRPIGF